MVPSYTSIGMRGTAHTHFLPQIPTEIVQIGLKMVSRPSAVCHQIHNFGKALK